MTIRRICDYCGLVFTGEGCTPTKDHHFCCYGCYLVSRILGTQGDEGIATWILLRLGIGAFLSMNVMMISLVLYADSPADLGAGAVKGLRLVLFILSTPAVFVLGSPFIVSAAKSLHRGYINIDTLIITGALAAYSLSTWHVIVNSGHVYFDTATMLLLIITLGRLMEASAKNKTSQAVKEMVDMVPRIARVIRGEEEIEIPVEQVRKGDILVVRPGERIPSDGRLVSGQCFIEESAFTGESRPRFCKIGDEVFGGSIDCDGAIRIKVTAVGEQSLLSQIQAMVHDAQQAQVPIEQLAEKISSVFLPVVWLTAVGAGVYWGIFHHNIEQAGLSALAVLVVACPCALGIATPMAASIAVGKAARAGILLRSGDVLECLPRIGMIFFDKTGTLTNNKLTVVEINTMSNGITMNEALALATSLEAKSEHAIARGIILAAQSRGCPMGKVTDVKIIPGKGITGNVTLDGRTRRVTVGSLKLLMEEHQFPEEFDLFRNHSSLTYTYIGWDGWVKAVISLSDSLREDSSRAVTAIKEMGIGTAIISGDIEGPTQNVADELGIDQIYFEQTPVEKASVINEYQSKLKLKRKLVALAGDGINDAPALVKADVGIAVGGGTDLASEAGDITLLGDDLLRIPWMIELAQKTYRIIKQNLFWAFGYNTIAIILAFFGYVHPLIAATAMFGSSLVVILNSMRLLKWEPSCAPSGSSMNGQTEP